MFKNKVMFIRQFTSFLVDGKYSFVQDKCIKTQYRMQTLVQWFEQIKKQLFFYFKLSMSHDLHASFAMEVDKGS